MGMLIRKSGRRLKQQGGSLGTYRLCSLVPKAGPLTLSRLE